MHGCLQQRPDAASMDAPILMLLTVPLSFSTPLRRGLLSPRSGSITIQKEAISSTCSSTVVSSNIQLDAPNDEQLLVVFILAYTR